MATLESLAGSLDADCVLLRERLEKAGRVAEYLVRRRADQKDFMEVR